MRNSMMNKRYEELTPWERKIVRDKVAHTLETTINCLRIIQSLETKHGKDIVEKLINDDPYLQSLQDQGERLIKGNV